MANPRTIESWVDRFITSARIGYVTKDDRVRLESILCAGAFEQGRLQAEHDRYRDALVAIAEGRPGVERERAAIALYGPTGLPPTDRPRLGDLVVSDGRVYQCTGVHEP